MTTNKVSSESPFYFQLIHVNNIWNIKTVFMQNGYRLQWYDIFPPFLIRYLAQLGLLLYMEKNWPRQVRSISISNYGYFLHCICLSWYGKIRLMKQALSNRKIEVNKTLTLCILMNSSICFDT